MAWSEAARRAAQEARKNQKKIIKASRIFGKALTDDIPGFTAVAPSSKPNFVSVSKLIGTQSTLNLRSVQQYRMTSSRELKKIEVIKKGDKYVILDGHHRAAAMIRKQAKTKSSKYIDVNVVGIARGK